MNFRRFILLLVSTLALSSPAIASASDSRFSKSLATETFAATGLTQLSTDELAVLDALVRRDIARSSHVSKTPRAAQFSARLTEDERHNAGLPSLNPSQLQQLDAAVQRLIVPPAESGRHFISASSNAGPYSVPSLKLRRDPEFRTHLTAMVAVGSDDYSAFGAGIDVTYVNPENDFALSVGYSEIHSKGGHPYRYYGDYYDGPYYRRPLDPFHPRW